MKKLKPYFFFLSVLLSFGNFSAYSQCTGTLGDPVVKLNFGAGATNPGSALAAGITNYSYVTATCPNDGQYSLRNATSGCFSSWHTLTEDHTSGDANGYFMIVNAANTAGEFYKQTISGLCPGTGYELSAFVVNLLRSTSCTSNPNRFPRLTFQIESTSGAILGTFNTPNVPTINGTATITPAQWSRYALFFTSNASTVVLKIINNAPGGCGNDLAIDDIEFRPCGGTLTASISGGTSICSGSSVTLTSTLSGGYVSPQYQWQSSTDNITFTNIAGATSPTLVRTPTVGTTYFRLLSSENGNINNASCRIASNVTTIITNPIPSPPSSSGAVYCQNAVASNLVASAPGTLGWYGTNSVGGSSTSTQTPSTSSTGTLNYYVSNTENGCESSRTAVPVVVNPLPSITANVGNVSCNGVPTGTITSSASGGTPGFTFSLDGTNFQSGNVFNGLAAGTYTITARDTKSCTATTSISLGTSNPISLSTEVENTCDILLNGKITAFGAGGVGSLEYSIDNITYSSTNVFTGLNPGNYTVYVRDNSVPLKCGTSVSVTVPNLVNPTVAAVAGSLCIAPNSGTVVATPSSNSSVAYQYSLNNGPFQDGNTFTNLSAGTYVVTLKDNRNCTTNSNPVTIVNIPIPPVVVTPAPFCANTIPAPLTATGASLLWYTNPTGGTGSSSQPTINTNVAGSQTYYVSQTIAGCESPRIELTVNISPVISMSLSKIDACNGLSNGSITASVSGGVSPFVFNLNGGAAGSSSFFDNLSGGTNYTVLVTDQNGCSTTSNITVANGPALTVSGTIGGDCIDMGAGSILPVGSGGTGAYTYKLNSGAFTSSVPFTGLNPGTFTICVKDDNGCTALTNVTIKPKPLAVASSNSGVCDVGGLPIIALEGLEAGTGSTYSWTGPNGFASNLQNPTLAFNKASGATEGSYVLTVNLDGCTSQSTVVVTCAGSAFPVKLKTFNANQLENIVFVNWTIQDAINFNRFELEKSKDAKSFEKIYSISSIEFKDASTFNFKDLEPFSGVNYYRLKMLDNDGSFSYSKIIGINFDKDGEYFGVENPIKSFEFQLFTNIVKPKIELFNVLGQKIRFETEKNDKGFALKTNVPHGMLLIKVQGEKLQKTLRLIVQ
jgi:hypothetical protein